MNKSIYLKLKIFLAWLIDTCIFTALLFSLYYLIVFADQWRDNNPNFFIESIEFNGQVNMNSYYSIWVFKDLIIYISFLFTVFASKLISGQWFGGISLGKKIMGLIAITNKKIYLIMQFFVWVIFCSIVTLWFPSLVSKVYFLPLLLLIDMLFLVFQGQLLHDFIFGVRVIDFKK